MSWPPPPSISKSAIDRLGQLLASGDASIGEVENARQQLGEWRAAHLWPLHCVANDLVRRLEQMNLHAIVAMRLKRLFRIVAKVQIHEGMAVSRMQDIAGIRIIVPSIQDVETLAEDIVRNQPECAEVKRVYDYLKSPKDNGYRSIHLALRHKESNSGYDGLLLELQIRTEAEHAWASSVEVNGITSGHHIKYDEGQPEWSRFFQLGAELVARSEGTASLAEFVGVDGGELIEELRALEVQLDAFDAMLSHRVRNHRELPKIERSTDAMGACFLFEFGNDPKNPEIAVFEADDQERAILRYASAEQRLAFEEGQLAPILVSVSSVDKLPVAYQTFFLDCSPYVQLLKRLVSAECPN
jgi:ppGpp synthetase/RelA/SpoT-type nucleotidyltranferase